jgi:ABC-2 type transport system permease protein
MAFGMDNLDLSSPLGFFGVAFLIAQVCLAIQASNYGFSLVSIEERELTADFLLAKPVGRAQILTSKLLAAITNLTITNAAVWISSIVFVSLYSEGEPYNSKALVLLLSSVIVFQLFFLTVGMAISLLVKRVRNVTPFSMALTFGMYALSAFSGMLGEETLDLITPFKHFDPNYILKNAAYDLPLVMISVTAIAISVAGSYVLYNRRNIPSAA